MPRVSAALYSAEGAISYATAMLYNWRPWPLTLASRCVPQGFH